MVEIMNGDVLKRVFKPIQIKTTYTMFDWLVERNMTLSKYLDFMKYSECEKSKNRTCKNFDCRFNYRILHKIEKTGDYEELKEMVIYHA